MDEKAAFETWWKDYTEGDCSFTGSTTKTRWYYFDSDADMAWQSWLGRAQLAAAPVAQEPRPSMALDRQFSTLLANYLDATEAAYADSAALKVAGEARKAMTDYIDSLIAAAPVAAQGERQPDTIKGICDFCSNESDVLAEVPGSRTMAGFVICPKCASEKNER